MRIFLTGSTGYIGRNLIEKLGNKYTILSPTHKQLDLLNSEAVDTFFRKQRFDVVIHCAVVGGSRVEEGFENSLYQNLKIFFNILRNINHFGRMINCGSGAEYDKSRSLKKVTENQFDKRVPEDEYGFFKYICSKYIEQSNNITNLRVFGLFGKYEDYRYRFISNAICRNIFNLPIILNKNVYFDYLYIDDFINIVDYFINHRGKYKSYNVGSGKSISMLSISKQINQIAKRKSKIIIRNKGLNHEYTCNNSRLIKELRKFEFTNFDIALHKLYTWYQENKELINIKYL